MKDLGRAIATVGIWTSPALVVFVSTGFGSFKVDIVTTTFWLAAMTIATIVIWEPRGGE